MAPTNNSAKALQNRSRPAVALPKAIVPALPLAYGRNHQKKTPARETGKENAPPATAPAESTAPVAAPPTTNVSPSMVNGTNEALSIEEAKDAPQTTSQVASDMPPPENRVTASLSYPRSLSSFQKTPLSMGIIQCIMHTLVRQASCLVDILIPTIRLQHRLQILVMCHHTHLRIKFLRVLYVMASISRTDGYGVPTTTEGFARRQMMAHGPSEGYSPATTPQITDLHRFNGFDPSTPHSVHGSQSSAPNDQEAGPPFYSQYPTAVISNGTNGHIDDVRLYQRPGPKQRTGSQVLPPIHPAYSHPSQMPMQVDNYDGLIAYLRAHFAETEFSDALLELRYSDDRATPVRISGHKLLFARSPTLKDLIQTQSRDAGAQSVQLVMIKSDDRFLRSDAFWLAVQRLYGGPLLDFGAMALASPSRYNGTAPMPGTPADRFDLALGYAASGSILQMPPVINRGVEIASHFINWDTIERGFDFALEGGLDGSWIPAVPHPNDIAQTSVYGPAVNMIIHNALNFILTSFPPNFELDTTVSDPLSNPRIPFVPQNRPTQQNSRLSFIKFGDHPTEESLRSPATNPVTVTLSRVLLNLPFYLLKYVLESSRLGNVSGWATSSLRHKVMHTVIEEREKRRRRAHESLHVPNEERLKHSLRWNAVGWQEAVVSHDGNEEMPTLTKSWVDFTTSDMNDK
ncbi:topoisomerase ii-associated protein [Rutstroemia sp. NJR-2017a BBW]|nr:topoisomerase ii-associated protein [Rutstroemia sp. NJR-2017a BBW]